LFRTRDRRRQSSAMFVYILRNLFTYQFKVRLGDILTAEIRSFVMFVNIT